MSQSRRLLPLLIGACCLVGGEASRPAAAAARELACARVEPQVVVVDDGRVQGETLRPDQLNDDAGVAAGGFGAEPGAVLTLPGPNLFVDRWYLLGPLSVDDPRLRGEADVDRLVGPDARPDLARTLVGADDRPLRWGFHRSLRQRVEPARAGKGVTWFAWTQVRVPVAREYWFAVGADDYGSLWVNGKLTWQSSAEPRAYRADEFVAPIELRAGLNDLLIRCRNDGGTMGWSLIFICDDGEDREEIRRALAGLHPEPGGGVRAVLSGPGRDKATARGVEAILDALGSWHADGGFRTGLPLELVGGDHLDELPCAELVPLLAGCHARDLPVNWGPGPALLAPASVGGDRFVVQLTAGADHPRFRLARLGAAGVARACEIDRHQLLRFLATQGGPAGAPILVQVAPAVGAARAWEVCDRAAVCDVRRLALTAVPGNDPVAAWLAARMPTAAAHARVLLMRAERLEAWSAALRALADRALSGLTARREAAEVDALRRLLAARHLELGPAEAPDAQRPARSLAAMRRAARRAVNAWCDFRAVTAAAADPSAAPDRIDRRTPLDRPEPLFASGPTPLPVDPMGRAVALERESRALCRWIFHRLRAAAAEAAPPLAELDPVLDAPALDPAWNAFFAAGTGLPAWVTGTAP